MKIFNKMAIVLLLAATMATGCNDDDIRNQGGETKPSDKIGYLSLSGLNVDVLSDTGLIEIKDDEYDTHRYLDNVKHDSARFSEEYANCRERYALPL